MEWLTGNVEQRTDDDIMDEAAGRARIAMAKESKARRAKEAKELKAKNKAMKKRLAEQRKTQRTDDNLDDEEAGKMRAVLAAKSKARREQQRADLNKKNSAVFGKIQNADDKTDSEYSSQLEPIGG